MHGFHGTTSLEHGATRAAMLAQAIARHLTAGLQAAFAGYRRHRAQARAIAQLRSMSDRELRDIGMPRHDIERLVRGETDQRRGGGRLAA